MAAANSLKRAYLDYNATAPLRPVAREAALMAMETTGNPSSVHAEGRAARRIVEDARGDVARLAGVAPVASHSCPAAPRRLTPRSIRISAPGGRSAARAAHRLGRRACLRPVGTSVSVGGDRARAPRRTARPRLARSRVPPSGRTLVALQGANNETGVVQPVAEAAALVHAAGGLLFCDAVQMAGRMACDLGALGADALMLSAHKMGGLKGAGALVTARPEIEPRRAPHARRRPGARRPRRHRGRRDDRGVRRRGGRVPAEAAAERRGWRNCATV